MLLMFQYAAPSSAPAISSLNGTGTLYEGQACTITGIQFTGASRVITLIQGGLSQTQTELTGSDTSLTFTANTAIFAYGPIVLDVTNANGTDQQNVTLNPVSGKGYVTVNVPWSPGSFSVLAGASPAAEDGDQLEYELVTNNGGNVTMFADGTFAIDDATQGHTFNVRAFDQTDFTWGASKLITVNYQPVVTIVDPVDTDGIVLLGQVGATILGTNFGGTAGTVTIGGLVQTVQSWTDTSIGIIVSPSTPVGSQQLAVNNGTTTGHVSVNVQAAAGSTPVFLGPSISVATLTQNTAMTPVSIASRFVDPVGQTLTFSMQGAWPPGVAVTAASGSIQGLPTVAGTYTGLAVRATDPDGNFVDSNTFTITVNAATVVVPPPDPTPSPAASAVGSSSGISDVMIANRALTKLGEARIISFDDDTKAARAIASMYYIVRDAELRRRKWRFAIKRTTLPALATNPEFGYAYAYQLPSDCLSILSVGDIAPGVNLSDYTTGIDTELYSVEGRTVLTDMAAPLKLRYKARITDPTQFDLTFVEALAARLAYEMAADLTQSDAAKQGAGNDYQVAVREAVHANAIEVAPSPLADDSWMLARI